MDKNKRSGERIYVITVTVLHNRGHCSSSLKELVSGSEVHVLLQKEEMSENMKTTFCSPDTMFSPDAGDTPL